MRTRDVEKPASKRHPSRTWWAILLATSLTCLVDNAFALSAAQFTESIGSGCAVTGASGIEMGADDLAAESVPIANAGTNINGSPSSITGVANTSAAGPESSVELMLVNMGGCGSQSAGGNALARYEFEIVPSVAGAPFARNGFRVLVTAAGSATITGGEIGGEANINIISPFGGAPKLNISALATTSTPSVSFSDTYEIFLSANDPQRVSLRSNCFGTSGTCEVMVDPTIVIDPTWLIDTLEAGTLLATDYYGVIFSEGVQLIPIPAAIWLFGSALGLLGWMRRKTAYMTSSIFRGIGPLATRLLFCFVVFAAPLNAATIDITGTIRDMDIDHPDFQTFSGNVTEGMVGETLGVDGTPTFVSQPTQNTNADNFSDWYSSGTDFVLGEMALTITLDNTIRGGPDVYTFFSNEFFPIDGLLGGNQGLSHNYHFTFRINSAFTYQGGESFSFTGDDDLWVFINNQLVVDLGGVHQAADGSVDLDDLGLTVGNTYAFDLFFAERRTTRSNFIIDTSILLEPIPIPAAFWLFGSALGLLGWMRRRFS